MSCIPSGHLLAEPPNITIVPTFCALNSSTFTAPDALCVKLKNHHRARHLAYGAQPVSWLLPLWAHGLIAASDLITVPSQRRRLTYALYPSRHRH
jgi:hypothetical protein